MQDVFQSNLPRNNAHCANNNHAPPLYWPVSLLAQDEKKQRGSRASTINGPRIICRLPEFMFVCKCMFVEAGKTTTTRQFGRTQFLKKDRARTALRGNNMQGNTHQRHFFWITHYSKRESTMLQRGQSSYPRTFRKEKLDTGSTICVHGTQTKQNKKYSSQ